MNDELLRKMNKVKNNLNSAKSELRNVKNIFVDSISVNGLAFKESDFSIIENKLNVQINNLNVKIIPKIKSM